MTDTDLQGVLASIGTAFCFAMSVLFFGAASRRVGQMAVNQTRLLAGALALAAISWAAGVIIWVPVAQFALLAASGVVGLALGDAALFSCLQIIGPRRGSLIMTLAPGFAALLMVPLLNEGISWVALVGMAITMAGIAWVVLERSQPGEIEGSAALGVFLGVLAAIGQAGGLVLAKAGLGAAPAGSLLGDVAGGADAARLHPLYGTLLRMVAASVLLGGWGTFRGSLRATVRAMDDRRALGQTMGGALFGPVLGVTLSLAAVAATNTAVAATIMATSPVVVIPLVRIVYGQAITVRALAGALIATAGVAVLTWRDAIAAWL